MYSGEHNERTLELYDSSICSLTEKRYSSLPYACTQKMFKKRETKMVCECTNENELSVHEII